MKAHSFIDKSTWGNGPWQSEPDGVEWHDQVTDYLCMPRRSTIGGAWGGYVGVPMGHLAYGKAPDALHTDHNFEVHGGLTYAADYATQHLWLLGFCGNHPYDLLPVLNPIRQAFPITPGLTPPHTYRDLDYVAQECAGLTQQLKGVT